MKSPNLLLFITLLSLTVTAQLPSISPFKTTVVQNGFLKNAGQVRDLNNKPVDFVFYQANMGGQQVFITKYGLSLLLSRPKKITRVAGAPKSSIPPQNSLPSDSLSIVTYEMERIDIVLKDASILPGNIITKADQQSPEFNFYMDALQKQGQRLQSEVLIKEVYPGIDWKVYIKAEAGKQPYLKYDFVVHPKADPSRIQLRYSDNATIGLTGQEIKGTTKMGTITEKMPFSYLQETSAEVAVAFDIKRNVIRFGIAAYDKSKTLVIDPSIFWLTYLSTTTHTVPFLSISGNGVETDTAGNIFVQLTASGNTPFPVLNPGGGAYYQDVTAAPNGSMIISKFAPGGQLLWSTYFGNGVGGRVMTIDKYGSIYAVGMLADGTPSAPITNPSVPLLNNGGYRDTVVKKYFITNFSNTGVLLWSSFYANYADPTDMGFDINGNVYVVGWSQIWGFPVVDPGGGAYAVTVPHNGQAQVLFISQFDAGCHLTWSTRIEGNQFDPYARVCTDKLGNIYIGGQTRSSNYPLVNAGGYFSNVSTGGVITRFNPARQMTWSTYYPAAYSIEDVTTDDSCNLYVAADKRILKFNSNTDLVFVKSVNTTQMHSWKKIRYDPYHDQLQLLGIMNDSYSGFPTLNTTCNGSFFNNGINPHTLPNGTGPIFATINHNGDFSYRSLVDWPAEYYQYSEMTVDVHGDPIYLFFNEQLVTSMSNPQLTNPGNGAYFDNFCCNYLNTISSLLLKLTSSDLSVNLQIIPPAGCSCNGSASVTTLCGQAPFSYVWSTGATTASVTGLCAGNYWAKVTDANHLSKTVAIHIPYPPGSITAFTSAVIPENCNQSNASITVQSVQGGTMPYTYSLDGISYHASPQFTGLDSGNHIISIKDVNGCIYKDTVFISRIPSPSNISYSMQQSSCKADDGQLHITNIQGGAGPYHYMLNGAGTNTTGIFTNLPAGSYALLISDTAGCSLSKTIVISKAVAATDATYSTGSDHCSQQIGFIQVNNVIGGTGPYTFSTDSLSFVTGIINHLGAGSYPLYIRDSNGCVLTKPPIIIPHIAGPDAVAFTLEQAYCGKSTGMIRADSVQHGSAPYRYSVDSINYTTSKVFAGIPPGIHKLYVKDRYECTHSEIFRIDYKPLPRILLSPSDTTVCYDNMIPLLLTGELLQIRSIKWSIPAQGFSATVKATEDKKIVVTITDSNNCLISNTSTIKVKACNTPEKCVVIPTAFTPNKDGNNEKIGPIANGCRIEKIKFMIYNRWGKLVFETKSLQLQWDGNYKGFQQPAGAYMFLCDYIAEDGISRQQTGTLMLIR